MGLKIYLITIILSKLIKEEGVQKIKIVNDLIEDQELQYKLINKLSLFQKNTKNRNTLDYNFNYKI